MRSPPLLKYFPYYQHTTVVCGGGGLNKYQGPAGDGVQRPLRSRFPPRLMPSVAMTSNVKSWEQLFSRHHNMFWPRGIGRGGASKRRRLILLLSVGWLPPFLPPSGACLALGSSILLPASERCRGLHQTGAAPLLMHVGNLLS